MSLSENILFVNEINRVHSYQDPKRSCQPPFPVKIPGFPVKITDSHGWHETCFSLSLISFEAWQKINGIVRSCFVRPWHSRAAFRRTESGRLEVIHRKTGSKSARFRISPLSLIRRIYTVQSLCTSREHLRFISAKRSTKGALYPAPARPEAARASRARVAERPSSE